MELNTTGMTTELGENPGPGGEAAAGWEEYAKAHRAAWAASVQALTGAARLTYPSGPVEFAGFLADVLASVAANVGGVNQLLADRSGSWETYLLAQIVTGALAGQEQYRLEHRTTTSSSRGRTAGLAPAPIPAATTP